MNFGKSNFNSGGSVSIERENKLLKNSFSWMALAMLLTSLSAYLFSEMDSFLRLLYNINEFGMAKPSAFYYILMFSPLAFVLVVRFGLNRLSLGALVAVFLSFAVVMGMSISTIFVAYESASIAAVFLSTTALFAIMAIAGYTTKTDLTKLGSILMIGFIGIFVASLINLFMQNDGMSYIISIIGVIIFTGLTAYDVQKIKNLGQEMGNDSAMSGKMGIMGALTLYLDFINLFLFLLRLFGDRK